MERAFAIGNDVYNENINGIYVTCMYIAVQDTCDMLCACYVHAMVHAMCMLCTCGTLSYVLVCYKIQHNIIDRGIRLRQKTPYMRHVLQACCPTNEI